MVRVAPLASIGLAATDSARQDTCSQGERDLELPLCQLHSTTGSARPGSSSEPSSLGCSGGRLETEGTK